MGPGDSSILGGRLGHCLAGLSFGMACTMARCPTNAYNALALRHLARPAHRVSIKLYNPFLTFYKHTLRSNLDQSLLANTAGEWRVGKTMVKLNAIDQSKIFDEPKWQDCLAFVKFEVGCKIPTKARLIQGNVNEATAYQFPDVYAAITGALKHIGDEWVVCDGVRYRFHYAGGMNHNELSDSFSAAVAAAGSQYILDERDGKNWDSTMQLETLTAEALVYDMLKLPVVAPFLTRSKECWGRVRCQGYAPVKYVTSWKRLSGDWNTSVGNTLISMIICATTVRALPDHLRPAAVEAYFMGDDYLGVYTYDQVPSPRDLHEALDHFECRCGITPERGLFRDPLAVTFISLGVWPRRTGGYQFVPQPAKQMVKLFCSVSRLSQKQVAEYNNGICIGFWHTYKDFAMMQTFLKAHYSPGVRGKTLDWYHIAQALTKEDRNVDWRGGFCLRYSQPYTSTFFELPKMPYGILQHPIVDLMLGVESMDPVDRPQCLYRPNKY